VSVAPAHGFIQAGGLRLHHLEFGGDGRPIVCLHGVCGHAWMWHDVAPRLTRLGRVVALDLRGHGDSQWSPAQEYTTQHHAADLKTVLDQSDGRQVDLVGLSWGGLVSLSYSAANPGSVRRLVVVDVPPSFTQSETDLLPRPAAFATHEEAVEWERGANPRASEEMLQVMARFGTRPAEGGLARKHDPYFLGRWPFRSDDHWAELESLELPVLLIHAEQSYVLSAKVAERMAGVIRNGKLVRVQHSGHHVPVENPGALAEAVTEFLS
jgi:pimeloyl-ACP methyl ester carboxylesterase